jgi:hypothetical protein
MDIEIPPWLYWVAYLAGSQWPGPPASETGCWRDAGYLHAAASQLEALIPELGRVRAQTQAVLSGQTAQATDEQFAKLFDGQYSVDKLVDALNASGDLAENIGTEIQYAKLSIITTLGIAAASIIFALANSEWTLGGSLAEIPIAELLAENSIREVVSMMIDRIEAALASALTKTMVQRLLVEGVVSAGIGAGQELAIEGFQVAEGHRNGIDVGQVLNSALSMGVAGMAGGLVGHGVGAVLGEVLGAEGTAGIVKNALTGLSSAQAANVAGTLAGGGQVGAGTFLGGAIGLVHGSLHGDSGHATPVGEPTESAVPANALDAHPTLRFEKQPDGTFAWPGEQASAVRDPSGSTSDGVSQAIAAPSTTSVADPAGAPGEDATVSPAAATAGEGATGSPGANGSPGGSDSAAKASTGSTATATSA